MSGAVDLVLAGKILRVKITRQRLGLSVSSPGSALDTFNRLVHLVLRFSIVGAVRTGLPARESKE